MKCTKCGFVSFDYLSECKKCGVSLAATRDLFGFPGTKSNVPFLLGSLIKDYVKPLAAEDEHLTADSSKQSLDFGFGDELELNGSMGNMDQAAQTGLAEQAVDPASQVLEGEDFTLLDISDDELNVLMSDDENVQVSDPGSGHASAADAPQAPAVTGAYRDSLIPRVDPSSLPGLAGQGSDYGGPVMNTDTTPRDDSLDENLIMDLSDKDLENFLSELDGSSEQENNPGSPAGKPKAGKP